MLVDSSLGNQYDRSHQNMKMNAFCPNLMAQLPFLCASINYACFVRTKYLCFYITFSLSSLLCDKLKFLFIFIPPRLAVRGQSTKHQPKSLRAALMFNLTAHKTITNLFLGPFMLSEGHLMCQTNNHNKIIKSVNTYPTPCERDFRKSSAINRLCVSCLYIAWSSHIQRWPSSCQ